MNEPLAEKIRAALQTNRLEPDIDEATLLLYAEGVASPVEREIVETMMEVDPAVAETVAAIREALEEARTPLPAPPAVRPTKHRRSFAWLSPTVSLAALVGAVALVHFQRVENARVGDRVAMVESGSPLPSGRVRREEERKEGSASVLRRSSSGGEGLGVRDQVGAIVKGTPGDAEPQAQSDAAMGSSAAPGASPRFYESDDAKKTLAAETRVAPAAPARRPQAEREKDDPLTRGIIFLSRNKIEEARREFRKLARTEPALAARLLQALG